MDVFLRLMKLFGGYWAWILLGTVIATITLLASVSLVGLSGWFLIHMASAGISGMTVDYGTPTLLIMICSLVRMLGRYLDRILNHEATFRVIAGLRVWFYEKLEPLAPARLQQLHSGEILSRLRDDIDVLENFHVRCLLPILVGLVSVTIFVVFFGYFSMQIALMTLVVYALTGFILPSWSLAANKSIHQRLLQHQGQLRAALVDGLQGMAELQVYQAASNHQAKIDALSQAIIDDQKRLQNHAAFVQAVSILCFGIALVTLLFLLVPKFQTGEIQAPELALLCFFLLASFEAVAPLPTSLELLSQTITAGRRIFTLVDQQPAVHEPHTEAEAPLNFELAFDNVSFHYPQDATDADTSQPNNALSNVSFTVPEGEVLLIHGPTGSGKSTLFNLLLKFWTPDQGNICIGGQSITNWQGDTFRQWISVVSQHTHLFATTIRENLCIAKPDATDDELLQACAQAQLHEFINQLPNGLDTWVGETGVRFSSGQIRRLALARALLKNAPIMLLDEPTEGLDSETERAMMQTLSTLVKGKTVLLISHRLGNMDWIDRRLQLRQGRVVSASPQAELCG